MENQNYHSSIIVKITPKEAFEKISRVSEWWATNFEGKSQDVNDIFTVRFKSGDMFQVKVVEFVLGNKIVWEIIDSKQSWVVKTNEWTGTKIIWKISTKKDGTQIDMEHLGLAPSLECFSTCTQGWDYLLHKSLITLLTDNTGLPV